eukprot:4582823-Prymnesium_polylepis.3
MRLKAKQEQLQAKLDKELAAAGEKNRHEEEMAKVRADVKWAAEERRAKMAAARRQHGAFGAEKFASTAEEADQMRRAAGATTSAEVNESFDPRIFGAISVSGWVVLRRLLGSVVSGSVISYMTSNRVPVLSSVAVALLWSIVPKRGKETLSSWKIRDRLLGAFLSVTKTSLKYGCVPAIAISSVGCIAYGVATVAFSGLTIYIGPVVANEVYKAVYAEIMTTEYLSFFKQVYAGWGDRFNQMVMDLVSARTQQAFDAVVSLGTRNGTLISLVLVVAWAVYKYKVDLGKDLLEIENKRVRLIYSAQQGLPALPAPRDLEMGDVEPTDAMAMGPRDVVAAANALGVSASSVCAVIRAFNGQHSGSQRKIEVAAVFALLPAFVAA